MYCLVRGGGGILLLVSLVYPGSLLLVVVDVEVKVGTMTKPLTLRNGVDDIVHSSNPMNISVLVYPPRFLPCCRSYCGRRNSVCCGSCSCSWLLLLLSLLWFGWYCGISDDNDRRMMY